MPLILILPLIFCDLCTRVIPAPSCLPPTLRQTSPCDLRGVEILLWSISQRVNISLLLGKSLPLAHTHLIQQTIDLYDDCLLYLRFIVSNAQPRLRIGLCLKELYFDCTVLLDHPDPLSASDNTSVLSLSLAGQVLSRFALIFETSAVSWLRGS